MKSNKKKSTRKRSKKQRRCKCDSDRRNNNCSSIYSLKTKLSRHDKPAFPSKSESNPPPPTTSDGRHQHQRQRRRAGQPAPSRHFRPQSSRRRKTSENQAPRLSRHFQRPHRRGNSSLSLSLCAFCMLCVTGSRSCRLCNRCRLTDTGRSRGRRTGLLNCPCWFPEITTILYSMTMGFNNFNSLYINFLAFIFHLFFEEKFLNIISFIK